MRDPEKKLKDTYNNAVKGLLKELSGLQAADGSQFSFETSEEDGVFRVATNVPDIGDKGTDKIKIAVEPNGRIHVDGAARLETDAWAGIGGYSTQLFSSTSHSAAKKAVKCVSKKAKEKGLVPK